MYIFIGIKEIRMKEMLAKNRIKIVNVWSKKFTQFKTIITRCKSKRNERNASKKRNQNFLFSYGKNALIFLYMWGGGCFFFFFSLFVCCNWSFKDSKIFCGSEFWSLLHNFATLWQIDDVSLSGNGMGVL